MKLISVRFKNFRNFYGDQEVSFSVDDEKNLTVIYAENGFGKTTFLNALNWTFFGTFTAGFERQDDLINRQAAKEGTKSASVDVTFEFLDNTYKATRFVEQRQGNQQTVFKIWKVSGGDQREVPMNYLLKLSFLLKWHSTFSLTVNMRPSWLRRATMQNCAGY